MEGKGIIEFNDDIYFLREDDNYFRLVDKKTGIIKKIYDKRLHPVISSSIACF